MNEYFYFMKEYLKLVFRPLSTFAMKNKTITLTTFKPYNL